MKTSATGVAKRNPSYSPMGDTVAVQDPQAGYQDTRSRSYSPLPDLVAGPPKAEAAEEHPAAEASNDEGTKDRASFATQILSHPSFRHPCKLR